MVIKKIPNDYNMFDIVFEDNSKRLNIFFCGNLDLYWSIYDLNNEKCVCEFLITKENYSIYELFLKLYNDVKLCNVRKEYDD